MNARGRRIAAALAGLALLGGCGGQPVGTFDRAAFLQQPAARAAHGLTFRPGTASLENGEAERLAGFLRAASWGDDHILLTVLPSGSPALDRRRVDAAARALGDVMPRARLHVVDSRDFDRTDERSDVVLVEPLGQGQLLVACPRQYATPLDRINATSVPPLGCANAANLAHMAARPADLVEPRRLGNAGGAVSAAAVLRHRTGEIIQPRELYTTDR